MLTTSFSCEISLTVRVRGTSSSIPDCRIGAVSMKITSKTSSTSTKGVTLMSESDVCVFPSVSVNAIVPVQQEDRCPAGLARCPASEVCSGSGGFLPPGLTVVPFRRVQKFQSEVIQSFGEFSNPSEKVVVADDRGDR